MQGTNWKKTFDSLEYPKDGVLSKVLQKNEAVDVTLFCMAAGTEISDHTSRRAGTVYVIEANGIFRLEGKDIPLLPGVHIYMQKDAVHSLSARENTAFPLTLINEAGSVKK